MAQLHCHSQAANSQGRSSSCILQLHFLFQYGYLRAGEKKQDGDIHDARLGVLKL